MPRKYLTEIPFRKSWQHSCNGKKWVIDLELHDKCPYCGLEFNKL